MPTLTVLSREYEASEVLRRSANATGVFLWIAVLSLANTLCMLSGADLYFPFGLGLTMLVDATALMVVAESDATGALVARAVAVCVDLAVAGAFVALWALVRRGWERLFLFGLIAYALDTLLVVGMEIGLAALCHAFWCFTLFSGWRFLRAGDEARALLAAHEQPEPTSAPALAHDEPYARAA